MLRLTWIYLAALLMFGCAEMATRDGRTHFVVPQTITDQLTATEECCKSLAEFRYSPLALGQTIDTKVDSTSPAFTFETGKSYFLAYRLPETNEPFQISVKSYFWGHAFFPAALVLDGHFEKSRFVGNPEFHYVAPGFIERGHIGGTVHFKSDSQERYLVILTTETNMNREVTSEKSRYAYATGTGSVHHFGPVGSLEVRASREQ